MSDKTSRRGFLRSLSASAGVAVVAVVAPEAVEREIVRDVVRHRAVYSDVLVTHGDGTKDGDMAMMKLSGTYRNVVRRSGKWGLMFDDGK